MTDTERADAAAMAAASRKAQGLGPTITDPGTLSRVATLSTRPDGAAPVSVTGTEVPAPTSDPTAARRGRASTTKPAA